MSRPVTTPEPINSEKVLREALERHMATHGGMAVYDCPACAELLAKAGSLEKVGSK